MLVRLAMPYDRERVLDLAQMQVAETLPHLDFERSIAGDTFDQGIATASPTVFVAEGEGREVIGFLMAVIEGYAFTTGHFVVQEVIYVHPDKRGTRAAAALFKFFIEWAKAIGAREAIMGVSNGVDADRKSAFISRVTGAEVVGTFLKKVDLSDGRRREERGEEKRRGSAGG